MEKRERNQMSKREEEKMEEGDDNEIDRTFKSGSVKRSDEFEGLLGKPRKKHCDWMKSNSDTYCPNRPKLLKVNYARRKAFGRLTTYVTDEPSAPDLSKKCEIWSR